MTPSSRLRLAIRKPARAASARAPTPVLRIARRLAVDRGIAGLPVESAARLLPVATPLAVVQNFAWLRRACIAAAVEHLPGEQQRGSAEVVTVAEAVVSPCVRHRLRATALATFLCVRATCASPALGSSSTRSTSGRRRAPRTTVAESPSSAVHRRGGASMSVEQVAIQQEVEIASRLRREILGLALRCSTSSSSAFARSTCLR